MKQIIFILFLTFILIFNASCVKTEEILITAIDQCKAKKKLDDPNTIRDEYDSCLLFKDEELKDNEGCRSICTKHCDAKELIYEKHWTDFAGCRCVCKVKLRSD
jgi:hypothetical protein